ncbi:MAG: 50S ribosomal protein L15 [Campylobacterales bacterium]|nr:50S ribosomal protein L15 [Campylobacterales bacterium]
MALENLTPAEGSTHKTKRIGRGQGSGWGSTAGRGGKGQTQRSGSKRKRNFEGGQTPMARRLPKIGFTSRVVKPYVINVEHHAVVAGLDEITMDSIRSVYRLAKSVKAVKLVGASAKTLASKIKDDNVTTTGN